MSFCPSQLVPHPQAAQCQTVTLLPTAPLTNASPRAAVPPLIPSTAFSALPPPRSLAVPCTQPRWPPTPGISPTRTDTQMVARSIWF